MHPNFCGSCYFCCASRLQARTTSRQVPLLRSARLRAPLLAVVLRHFTLGFPDSWA